MSLKDLNKGQSGIIVNLDLNKESKQKFMSLGFIPGTFIETLFIGRGIKIYKVKTSQYALRNEDASKIYLK